MPRAAPRNSAPILPIGFEFFGGGVRVGTLLVLSMLALSAVVLGARGPWLYAAAHVGVRAVANYVTQELDRRATALAGAARARNDQIGSALRFGGMLLGPLWLGAVGEGATEARQPAEAPRPC